MRPRRLAVAGGPETKFWRSSDKSAGEFNGGSTNINNLPLTLWLEGGGASSALRDVSIQYRYEVASHGNTSKDWAKATFLDTMPLGGSGSVSSQIVGAVYVPTRHGGNLKLTGSSTVKLYYTDGSELTMETVDAIAAGTLTPIASGNPCTYTVPSDMFKWFYVAQTSGTASSVSCEFWQTATADKTPWACPWYPLSDEQSPNLYDAGECLDKYDTAYGADAREVEMTSIFAMGDYLLQDVVREDDFEVTSGYDYPNENGQLDPGEELDFYDGVPPDGVLSFPGDGDTIDVVDLGWYGHCNERAAAIMCEDEPSAAPYQAPNSVVFDQASKKGLLVALYHGFSRNEALTTDPAVWHGWLESILVDDEEMFACDVFNSGAGPDQIWNAPVYELTKAQYSQAADQDNERIVTIACEFKYWLGDAAQSGYYLYDVEYSTSGEVVTSSPHKQ